MINEERESAKLFWENKKAKVIPPESHQNLFFVPRLQFRSDFLYQFLIGK